MTSNDNDIWKPEEYLTYHKLVFRVMFDFLNSHFPPQDSKEWWKQFAVDSEQASDQVKGGKLANGFLFAIGNYLEDEYKKRRTTNG